MAKLGVDREHDRELTPRPRELQSTPCPALTKAADPRSSRFQCREGLGVVLYTTVLRTGNLRPSLIVPFLSHLTDTGVVRIHRLGWLATLELPFLGASLGVEWKRRNCEDAEH